MVVKRKRDGQGDQPVILKVAGLIYLGGGPGKKRGREKVNFVGRRVKKVPSRVSPLKRTYRKHPETKEKTKKTWCGLRWGLRKILDPTLATCEKEAQCRQGGRAIREKGIKGPATEGSQGWGQYLSVTRCYPLKVFGGLG